MGGIWEESERYLGVSEWYSWKLGKLEVLEYVWGYTGSQSLQYGVKTLFWHSLEWYGFLSTDHTETSKYQNRRIEAYQK